MIRSKGAALVAAIATAGIAAVAGLVADRGSAADASFARATAGLGLGPATSPAWSFFGFDPRLEAACESELFPLPGLSCPDPTHNAGVAGFAARP